MIGLNQYVKLSEQEVSSLDPEIPAKFHYFAKWLHAGVTEQAHGVSLQQRLLALRLLSSDFTHFTSIDWLEDYWQTISEILSRGTASIPVLIQYFDQISGKSTFDQIPLRNGKSQIEMADMEAFEEALSYEANFFAPLIEMEGDGDRAAQAFLTISNIFATHFPMTEFGDLYRSRAKLLNPLLGSDLANMKIRGMMQ